MLRSAFFMRRPSGLAARNVPTHLMGANGKSLKKMRGSRELFCCGEVKEYFGLPLNSLEECLLDR